MVAPLVGAWIETQDIGLASARPDVAPLVGAWIETCYMQGYCKEQVVAPLVGAWIETVASPIWWQGIGSHPSWVRGLKL